MRSYPLLSTVLLAQLIFFNVLADPNQDESGKSGQQQKEQFKQDWKSKEEREREARQQQQEIDRKEKRNYEAMERKRRRHKREMSR